MTPSADPQATQNRLSGALFVSQLPQRIGPPQVPNVKSTAIALPSKEACRHGVDMT
jgi:hypothetical protein